MLCEEGVIKNSEKIPGNQIVIKNSWKQYHNLQYNSEHEVFAFRIDHRVKSKMADEKGWQVKGQITTMRTPDSKVQESNINSTLDLSKLSECDTSKIL